MYTCPLSLPICLFLSLAVAFCLFLSSFLLLSLSPSLYLSLARERTCPHARAHSLPHFLSLSAIQRMVIGEMQQQGTELNQVFVTMNSVLLGIYLYIYV